MSPIISVSLPIAFYKSRILYLMYTHSHGNINVCEAYTSPNICMSVDYWGTLMECNQHIVTF